MKLGIAMVTSGTVKSQTAFALFRLMHHLPYQYDFFLKEGALIHYGREILVKQALQQNCTHILFVDSDMFFEADAATRLMQRGKDIIGVHSNHRRLPPITTIKMDEQKWKNIPQTHPDGLVTCDALGTGFLLINLDVFKKISEPWFFFEVDEKGETTMGEDHWFCRKAREAGYEIWADLSIPIKHIGDYFY